MPYRNLPTQSLHAGAVEAIACWIVGGRFKTGTLLPNEAEIGEELKISRTVVREAVRTLVAKGMLATRRRLGTVVMPIDRWSLFDRDVLNWRLRFDANPRFIEDLYEFRTNVETYAVVRCATDPLFAKSELMSALVQLEAAAAAGGDGWVAPDILFHRCLLSGSGNQFFQHIEPVLDNVFHLLLSYDVMDQQQVLAALPLHRTVAEAVVRGDAIAARNAMEQLVDEGRRNLLELIRIGRFASAASERLGDGRAGRAVEPA